jgi:hypothetical protein
MVWPDLFCYIRTLFLLPYGSKVALYGGMSSKIYLLYNSYCDKDPRNLCINHKALILRFWSKLCAEHNHTFAWNKLGMSCNNKENLPFCWEYMMIYLCSWSMCVRLAKLCNSKAYIQLMHYSFFSIKTSFTSFSIVIALNICWVYTRTNHTNTIPEY